MKCLILLVLASLSLGAPQAPKATPVEVEKAKSNLLYQLLTYPARLQPKINASLLSETEGVVTEIFSPLGTAVERGARLLTIKNTDPIYSYAPYHITSPVKGAVSSLEVSVGSRIVKGQKLGTITDPSQVLIIIEVAASDIFSITKNLEGKLKLPGVSESIAVVVRGVSPFVDPGTGTATGELVLKDKIRKNPLPPGSVGSVSFQTQEHQGIELPESSIVYKGKDPQVRIVENGKAKYLPVILGNTREGQVEILKGITPGMDIIVRSAGYISDGEDVVAQEKKS